MRKLWFKWSILVCLSALVSFALGFNVLSEPPFVVGMVAGIVCFIAFYVWLDNKLIVWQRQRWRKALLLGVVIKILLQAWPIIEIDCGMLSLMAIESVFGRDIPFFWHGFLATLSTGTLLSLVVGILTALLHWLLGFWQRFIINTREMA